MFAMYTFVCAIKVNLICKLVDFFVLAFRVLAFRGTPAHLKGSSSALAETFSLTGLRTVPIPVVRYVTQGVLLIVVHIVFNWATRVGGYFGHLHSLHIVNIFLINVTSVSPLYDSIIVPKKQRIIRYIYIL